MIDILKIAPNVARFGAQALDFTHTRKKFAARRPPQFHSPAIPENTPNATVTVVTAMATQP
jgi:hypothetical protein